MSAVAPAGLTLTITYSPLAKLALGLSFYLGESKCSVVPWAQSGGLRILGPGVLISYYFMSFYHLQAALPRASSHVTSSGHSAGSCHSRDSGKTTSWPVRRKDGVCSVTMCGVAR